MYASVKYVLIITHYIVIMILPVACIQLVKQPQVHYQCSGYWQTSLGVLPINFEPTTGSNPLSPQVYVHSYLDIVTILICWGGLKI